MKTEKQMIDYIRVQVGVLLWDPEYGLLLKKGGDSLPWTDFEKREYESLKQTDIVEAARYKKNTDCKYRDTPSYYSVKGTHEDVFHVDAAGVPTTVSVVVSGSDYDRYKNEGIDLWSEKYAGDYKIKSKLIDARLVDVAITVCGVVNEPDRQGNYGLVFAIHTAPVGTYIKGLVQVKEDELVDILYK